MLSRVAENIYWMARFIERAENTARLISVNANLLLDLPRGVAPGWQPLIDMSGGTEEFIARYGEFNEKNVLRFLIADLENTSSIISSLHMAREDCRTIRDTMPREAWEQLNELYLYAKEKVGKGVGKRSRHAYLKQIILGSQTITGLLAGAMNHDEGYRFLRVGRNLERADMTTRIIDVRSATLVPDPPLELRPFDNIQWVSVLRSLSGYQMYRRSMQVQVRRPEVLRFLFQSAVFPRSIFHTMEAIERSLEGLAATENPLRIVGRIKRILQDTDVGALQQDALHGYIDDLQLGFIELHQELDKTYFNTAVNLPQKRVDAA
ncbi:MAG: alpha-E domain-containing protein [Proteobacteria bacterium]|nr:MAG: alpha-E domain-containing protein [Pseudomonadota bacterium]QKK10923.1 MAG: alpha-E domain-containing protein [Pseudomonadota bacterium]